MSRFHFNEEDDYDDDDLFEDEEDDDLSEQMYMLYPHQQSNQYLQVAQTGLAVMELNHKMVRLAVEVAGKSWFWRLRRLDKKLEIIDKAYKKLSTLLEVKDKNAIL